MEDNKTSIGIDVSEHHLDVYSEAEKKAYVLIILQQG